MKDNRDQPPPEETSTRKLPPESLKTSKDSEFTVGRFCKIHPKFSKYTVFVALDKNRVLMCEWYNRLVEETGSSRQPYNAYLAVLPLFLWSHTNRQCTSMYSQHHREGDDW